MDTAVSDSLANTPISPTMWWFPIPKTIAIVALALVGFIVVVTYFAGGKENRKSILLSIIASVCLAVFSMPLVIKAVHWSGLLNTNWGTAVVIIVMFIVSASVSVHIYELVTVSARQARPPE